MHNQEGKQQGDRQRVAVFRVAEEEFHAYEQQEVKQCGAIFRNPNNIIFTKAYTRFQERPVVPEVYVTNERSDDGDTTPWGTQPSFVVMLFLSLP